MEEKPRHMIRSHGTLHVSGIKWYKLKFLFIPEAMSEKKWIRTMGLWPSGCDVGLKIRRSGVRFPVLAMCRSVANFVFHTSLVHPAVMGIWCTDARLGQ